MHNRRWWGLGLLGIALAGTIALVIPSEAQTGAMLARNDFGSAARQPDRAVQQEAQAIANRIEEGMRRSASLLQTLADGDLTVFDRDRVALNAASSQWPIALFTATPGKGSDFSVQPPGERFLGPDDVEAVQKQGVWVSERAPLKSVLIAVPSRTGQVLASRVPFEYFTQGLNAIPHANGVRRYLLDASGKPLERDVAPNGEDRDWCQQLLQLGEGFLATSDAMFSVARVPSTGWAVVVRHPLGHVNPVATFDAGTLGGPTMVASGPLQAPGLPKGILLYPLAGAALLFGLAIVGWKQRWPGLEDGPIAFGEHAIKSVTAPLRDRFDRRMPPSEALPPSSETGLATFAAEVPSKLPAAIAGGDVDFLRTEQVRNLRELWSHTEERLSGQRNWVRDEVRRVQDSTTTSVAELGSIVNLAEQRLEDARSAWGEVQASLLARIDEARGGLASEQALHEEFRSTVADELETLRTALAAEQQAREEQGKRLAKGLGDLASGLESETTDRGLHDDRLIKDLAQAKASLEAALDAERLARGEANGELAKDLTQAISSLEAALDAERQARSNADGQLAQDLSHATSAIEASLDAERQARSEADGQLARDLSHTTSAIEASLESERAERAALGDRLARDLSQAMAGLEAAIQAERAARSEVDEQLVKDLSDAHASIQALVSAEQQARGELGDRLAQDLAGLRTDLAAGREAHGALSTRLERDLEALGTLMNEEFTRLEGVLLASRTVLTELDAREADSRQQWQAALAVQSERTDRMAGELGEARQAVAAELLEQSNRLQLLVTDTQAQLGAEVAAIADRTQRLGDSLGSLEAQLGSQQTTLDQRLGEVQRLVQEALPPLRQELDALRDLSHSVEQISLRLDAHAERFEGLSALEQRLIDLGQRMDKRFQDLEATRRSFDERVEAANARVLQQADELEETNERLYGLGDEVERLSDELEAARGDLGTLGAALEARQADQQKAFSEVRDQHQELDRRLTGRIETLDRRTEKLEDRAMQRLESNEAKLAELSGKVSEHDRKQADLEGLPAEFSGLKARLEGMSMAHARQQEALNTAVQQLSGLQRAVEAKASDTTIQEKVADLTRFVQQLAEQSQLLAQALDASTAAASRSESWVGEQLSVIRSEQAEAVSALSQENLALRDSLHSLKESNEALSNRMHMVVQVLSKISK